MDIIRTQLKYTVIRCTVEKLRDLCNKKSTKIKKREI
jgi:hypothetical protein